MKCTHLDRPSVVPARGNHTCAECFGPVAPFVAEPFGGVDGYCGPISSDLTTDGLPLIATERKGNAHRRNG